MPAAVSRRNLPLCHRGRIATGASPSPSCQPVFVPYKRLARRCRLSAAIRGKLYPPEVINHFWQSICLRSSPHKYSPPHIKFLQIFHISPDLSNSLDRKHQYPDAKSNIFDKMLHISFTVPQNPRKTAVSQTGTSLAITMGRRSTDRRIYVSLFE